MARYFYIISFMLAAGSAACLAYKVPYAPAALAFGAAFAGSFGVRKVSRPIDFLAWFTGLGALAACFQPADITQPWFALCSLMIFVVPMPRTIFMNTIGLAKFPWLEFVSAAAALLFYVLGNLLTPAGWESWVYYAPHLFFSVMHGIGSWSDIMHMKHTKGKTFRAGVGVEAPDFSLPDQDGREVTLSGFRGRGSVLLVFVRGDWCPSCHIMLRSYERNKEKFQQKEVTIMAIGPDPVGVNRDMVMRLGMSYHILADEKHECAKKYGIQLHANNGLAKFEEGIPLPASFLVCPQGVVRFTSRADVPGEILNPEDIFPVLEKIA